MGMITWINVVCMFECFECNKTKKLVLGLGAKCEDSTQMEQAAA